MGRLLKRLGDFNGVITYYQDIISYVENMNPLGAFHAKEPTRCISYDRALINNIGISIAQNFEFFEEYKDSDIDKVIMDELESFCRDIKYPKFKDEFKKIMDENGLTPFEVLKQIRNALLHGDYEIEMVTPKDFKIYEFKKEDLREIRLTDAANLKLNGQSIQATLDYPETVHIIETFFENLRLNRFPSKNIEFIFADPKYEVCKNRHELAKFIEGYNIYEIIPIGKTEKGNKKEVLEELKKIILKKYPAHAMSLGFAIEGLEDNINLCETVLDKNQFELKPLDKEELNDRRNYIKSYIEYLGFSAWQNLGKSPLGVKNMVFNDFYASTFGHTSFSGISNRCCTAVRQYSIARMDKKQIKDIPGLQMAFAIILHEKPIIYSNLMLGMLNYSCGYLKENNSNEGTNLFDYHNLDSLKTLSPTIDRTGSIKLGMDSKELKKSLDNQISGLEKQKNNVEKSIEKISKNINDKNPKKEELEASKIEQEKRCKELEERLVGLKTRKDQYGATYDDYSEFFRHMRNSIAHGRYTIDYSNAFRTKDLSKIKYTFRDYEKDDKVNPSFEITLTAKQLYKIVKAIQDKVNEQTRLEGSYSKIDSSDVAKIMPASELLAVKKLTVEDLHKSDFIKEEDKVDSFDIKESVDIDKGVSKKTYDDK